MILHRSVEVIPETFHFQTGIDQNTWEEVIAFETGILISKQG